MDDVVPDAPAPRNEDRNLSTLGWGLFWKQLLGQAGTLLLLAGIICFFAFNWADMPAFAKFGVIIVGMLLAATIPLVKGLDHFAGSAGLLFCGLLAGTLLAVFGQVYQTGADAWELFRVWALFLIPLALLGRQTGLWCATWLISTLWAIFWLSQEQHVEAPLRYPPFLFGQFAFLLLWESSVAAALRGLPVPRPLACLTGPLEECSFLSNRWFPRLLGAFILSVLTLIMLELVITLVTGQYTFHSSVVSDSFFWTTAYCLFLAAGGWWYTRIRPDTFMHALGLFSLASVLLTGIVSRLFKHGDSSVAFLLSSLLFVGCGVAVGKLILVLHKKNRQTLAALQIHLAAREEKAPEIRARARQLWRTFRLAAGIPEQSAHVEEADGQPAMPWYGRLFIGLCAWIASFLLIGFLGMLFQGALKHLEENVLFLGAALFFPLGFVLERKKNLFPQQLGLALLFAGAGSLIAWLIISLHLENYHSYLAMAVVLIPSCLLVRNGAYRCLSTFLCLYSLPLYVWWLFSQRSGFMSPLGDDPLWARIFSLWIQQTDLLSMGLLYLSCCVGFAHLWRLYHIPSPEGFSASRRALLRSFAYGAFVAMLCWGAIPSQSRMTLLGIQSVSMPLSLVGPAAGVALTYLVARLGKDLGLAPAVRLGSGLAAIGLAVLSWWLPWAGVGLFALALARQAGNVPLQGLCIAFLAVLLNVEYYSLESTLLFKSMTLCGLGLLFLLAAFGISHLLKKAIRTGYLPNLETPETPLSGNSAQSDAAVQEPSHA